MKLLPHNATTRRTNERGYIVIALLFILSILLIYAMVNARYLNDLRRELQLFEREQIKRLEKRATKTAAWFPSTNSFSQTQFRVLNP